MYLCFMEMKIINALKERYATKKFDADKKLTEEKLEALIETTRLTATSFGLQLMKLVVVENQEIKEKLVSLSYGQRQVADASHVLVLCRESKIKESHIEAYIDNISKTRDVELNKLDGYKKSMKQSILSKSEEQLKIWMNNQIYIALGKLLTVCALLKIDSCPMEGFQSEEYDKILGLEALNLASVLVLPVGYRSEMDKNASAKKVRRSKENFVIRK